MTTQNRQTGAAAEKWGHKIARQVAAHIGAKMISTVSNEAIFRKQRVVIKCAHLKNNKIGITAKMLPSLDAVIAAFEVADGSFELWIAPRVVIESLNTIKVKRRSVDQVMVLKSFFVKHGKRVAGGQLRSDSLDLQRRHYVVYWKPYNFNWLKPNDVLLDHAAGAQLIKVATGDRLYIITYRSNMFYLTGRINVSRVTDATKAARLLGRRQTDLKQSKYHVVASEPVMRAVAIPFTNTLQNVDLVSKGQVGILNGPNSVQRFRVMREITQFSATVLDALLADISPKSGLLPDVDIHRDDRSSFEGNINLLSHLRRERDPAIVKRKKQTAATLACEACGFSFAEIYGELAANYCEVHHVIPLSQVDSIRETRMKDLAILCANCHRVAHLKNPALKIVEIKSMLRSTS